MNIYRTNGFSYSAKLLIPLLFFMNSIANAKSINWPKIIKTHSQKLKKLDGGFTNETFTLHHEGETYLVKFLSPNAIDLGINRTLEFDFQSYAARLDLSPRIMYMNEKKGLYVAKFIKGKSFTSKELQQKNNLIKSIQLLKKIHRRTRPKKYKIGSNTLKRAKEFMEQLRKTKSPYLKDLKKGYAYVMEIAKSLPAGNKQVASHNDFFSGNIIHHKGKLRVIDWEYAEWACLYNDLTLIIVSDDLPERDHQIILETYFGTPTPKQIKTFKDILFIQRFVTLCWYASQLSVVTKEKLYLEYQKRYEKYLKRFQNSI